MSGPDRNKWIAVIGGGIFGSTAAIALARAGHAVDLFERAPDIMQAASGINQYRMHRGYHYPRSVETIQSCVAATPEFEAEYGDAIISHHSHYYAIAKEGSKVSGNQYLEVLKTSGLPFTVTKPLHINHDAVDVVVEAEENLYDPSALKAIIKERLLTYGVNLHFGVDKDVDECDDYDHIVVATYAGSNSVFKNRPEVHKEYQFEVCEKIVIEIPTGMERVSTVVMDGPFTCFDPLGQTGLAVVGHVEHAIHHRSFGNEPEIPEELRSVLNKGIIKRPSVSTATQFLEAASYFMPPLEKAKHVGSMYTIRTVLPRVDDTDTRPTIVNQIDDRIITIYSGKVGNSVRSARRVRELIEQKA